MTDKKSSPIEEFAQMAKARIDELLALFFEKFVPEFDQKDIDKLYKKLREPLQSVQDDVTRFSEKYPMLKTLGSERVGWIVLQAADTLHLAASLFNHHEVSSSSKAKLACSIAYFISPIDILPEGILGPIGYVDDVLLVIWVIDSILNGQNEAEKALIRELWQGKEADLEELRGLLKHLDVLKSLRHFFAQKKVQ